MCKSPGSILRGCFLLGVFSGACLYGQGTVPKLKSFPLWNFDERGGTCRAKGRLQDKDYCDSKLMDQIVAQESNAIPVLISQLADSRKVKEPIYDYWSSMTVGDIAYFILNDLFTDADWSTFNLPGLTPFKYGCSNTAEQCWRAFLKTHSRESIQRQWRAAWNASSAFIHWDAPARCFRRSKKAAQP